MPKNSHPKLAKIHLSFTTIFNGLKTGKVFKLKLDHRYLTQKIQNFLYILCLDPEVAKFLRHIMISLYFDYISLLFNFYATSGSSIKSQVLDLKTLPIFSPLKISVIVFVIMWDE